MTDLKCPRCRQIVPVDPAGPPVCPACGFGSDAVVPPAALEGPPRTRSTAPVAPGAAAPTRSPLVPRPAPVRAAPSPWRARRRRRRIVLASVAAVLLLVAGALAALLWAGDGPPPHDRTRSDAQEAALLAVAALSDDLAAPGSGDLRSAAGSFRFSELDELGGAGTFDFRAEWGLQRTASFVLDLASEGGFAVTVHVEMHCGVDRDVLVFGGTAYERRTASDCLEEAGAEEPDGLSSLDPATFAGVGDLAVQAHPDGSITATFQRGNASYEAEVDPEGRVRSVTVHGPTEEGRLDLDYGSRRVVVPPAADERIPSAVSGYCFVFEGACTYTARGGDDAPLSDFEVRVYPVRADPAVAMPMAVFDLGDGGSVGAYNVSFHLDGDGTFGDGDSFDVSGPGVFDVVVWDRWADRDVADDVDAPGPGPFLLVAALLGALFAHRRRTGRGGR